MRENGQMRHDDLLAELRGPPATPTRDAYLRFVGSRGEDALRRNGGDQHVTGSCFVLSPARDRILLCFHGKGGFWVQFGGHVEDEDPSLAAAAVREAREESGVAELRLLGDRIVDLDRHELHGGFSCAAHWDIGYVALADPATTATAVSEESEDVRWFPVDALPDTIAPGFAQRLAAVLRAAR